jgi:hypothetical protein
MKSLITWLSLFITYVVSHGRPVPMSATQSAIVPLIPSPLDFTDICTNCPDPTNPPVPLNGTRRILLTWDDPFQNTNVCQVTRIVESPDINATNWQTFIEVRSSIHIGIYFYPQEAQMFYRACEDQVGFDDITNLQVH